MSNLTAYSVVPTKDIPEYTNNEDDNLVFEAYDADEVDKLIKEKDDEIENLKCYLGQIAEQKDKIINDLIKALQNNGPRFVEFGGELINLNNVAAVTHVVQMSDGSKFSGNLGPIKSIIKSKYMEKLDDNGRNPK